MTLTTSSQEMDWVFAGIAIQATEAGSAQVEIQTIKT